MFASGSIIGIVCTKLECLAYLDYHGGVLSHVGMDGTQRTRIHGVT